MLKIIQDDAFYKVCINGDKTIDNKHKEIVLNFFNIGNTNEIKKVKCILLILNNINTKDAISWIDFLKSVSILFNIKLVVDLNIDTINNIKKYSEGNYPDLYCINTKMRNKSIDLC